MDQIAELERMGEECAALEQELAELDQAVRAKQRKEEALRKAIEQAEDVKRRLSDAVRELEPKACEDLVTKLEENRQRLEMLETARGNLSGTLLDVREILGEMPVNDSGAMLDGMKAMLQGLLNYTDRLQKNLVLYAKSVTLEERK